MDLTIERSSISECSWPEITFNARTLCVRSSNIILSTVNFVLFFKTIQSVDKYGLIISISFLNKEASVLSISVYTPLITRKSFIVGLFFLKKMSCISKYFELT